jgi:hypothetical protein
MRVGIRQPLHFGIDDDRPLAGRGRYIAIHETDALGVEDFVTLLMRIPRQIGVRFVTAWPVSSFGSFGIVG